MCRVETEETQTFANDTVYSFHRGVTGETYKTPSGRVNSVTEVTLIRAGLHEHPSFVRSKVRRVLFPHSKSSVQRHVWPIKGKIIIIIVCFCLFSRQKKQQMSFASRRRCQSVCVIAQALTGFICVIQLLFFCNHCFPKPSSTVPVTSPQRSSGAAKWLLPHCVLVSNLYAE